jgi:hypothetical protein
LADWWDIDFCSKSAYFYGSRDYWFLLRDPSKVLFEKQIYAGNNLHLLMNPANHLKAIQDSVSADLPIPFILDILNLRKSHVKFHDDG